MSRATPARASARPLPKIAAVAAAGAVLLSFCTPSRAAAAEDSVVEIAALVSLPGGGLDVVREQLAAADVTSRLQQLRALASVRAVSATSKVRALETAVDPLRVRQWGLDRLGASRLNTVAGTGSGVVVAVVDTGVDASHPDLSPVMVPGTDILGAALERRDPNGHGTHVAGIVAAQAANGVAGAGLAPDVRIMPVRVLDETGYGDDADVAKGVLWAVDHGAKILNLSLGGTDISPVLREAVAYSVQKGSLVVAAAGNSAMEGNPVIYPASYAGAFAVAATMPGDVRAPFSSTGSFVDIAAPGFAILSTFPNGSVATLSGTSMAAPFVSASAAIVSAQRPELTGEQIAALLAGTAFDVGAAGRDDAFGAGVVDALMALTGERTPPSPPLQLPSVPTVPTLPMPTLPALPSLPLPNVPDLPQLPKLPLPTLPALPPLPSLASTAGLLQASVGSVARGGAVTVRVWSNSRTRSTVELQSSTGAQFSLLATLTTAADGTASYVLRPTSSVQLRFVEQGRVSNTVNVSVVPWLRWSVSHDALKMRVMGSTDAPDDSTVVLQRLTTSGWSTVARARCTSGRFAISAPFIRGAYRLVLSGRASVGGDPRGVF